MLLKIQRRIYLNKRHAQMTKWQSRTSSVAIWWRSKQYTVGEQGEGDWPNSDYRKLCGKDSERACKNGQGWHKYVFLGHKKLSSSQAFVIPTLFFLHSSFSPGVSNSFPVLGNKRNGGFIGHWQWVTQRNVIGLTVYRSKWHFNE